MTVTLDDLPVKYHDAWQESVDATEGVKRGEVQSIGVRISEAEYTPRMDNSQPLMWRPAKSFANFDPYLINLGSTFRGRLLSQDVVDNTLQRVLNNSELRSFHNLFSCMTRLNRDAQDIQNFINRCKQG